MLALAALVCAGVMIALAATNGQSPPAETDPAGTPRPAGSPTASAAPATGPEPPVRTDAERDLAARLSSFELTDCQAATDDVTGSAGPGGPTEARASGVTAALRCAPGVAAGGRPPTEVVVLGYADAGAMTADAARRSAATVDVGSCEAGQTSSEAYLLPSRRTGTFVCEAEPGGFTIYWTIDRERVGFIAESADPNGLIAWWRAFDPL
ncbi:hypothetical protein UG55_103051 [Frankia sp. EI5c]|nr:hypothetical protein UG55_103051 [Frankia sp. EI5c]